MASRSTPEGKPHRGFEGTLYVAEGERGTGVARDVRDGDVNAVASLAVRLDRAAEASSVADTVTQGVGPHATGWVVG